MLGERSPRDRARVGRLRPVSATFSLGEKSSTSASRWRSSGTNATSGGTLLSRASHWFATGEHAQQLVLTGTLHRRDADDLPGADDERCVAQPRDPSFVVDIDTFDGRHDVDR